jgi:hypothetical protein
MTFHSHNVATGELIGPISSMQPWNLPSHA